MDEKENQQSEDFQRGKRAEETGDYETAARHYQKAVELDSASAELALGKLYFFGKGVPQDYEAAHLHIQRARETTENREEEAEALYYIAQMFRRGLGVEKHFMKAYNRLIRSADLGNGEAMYTLGEIWESGEYERDAAGKSQTVHWYDNAMNRTDTHAMRRLAQIYEKGEYGIPKDEDMAAYFGEHAEAAETAEELLDALLAQTRNESADATTEPDNLHMTKKRIGMNKYEAMLWYRKAAEANNKKAMDALIRIFDDERKIVEIDYRKKKARADKLKAETEYWKKRWAELSACIGHRYLFDGTGAHR